MQGQTALNKEAELLAKYICGERPTAHIVRLYGLALKSTGGSKLAPKDQAMLNFALKNPRLLPFLDNGLALKDKESGLRRHIYCMIAILETEPAYSDKFLPKKSNIASAYIKVVFIGVGSIIKSLLGLIIIEIAKQNT